MCFKILALLALVAAAIPSSTGAKNRRWSPALPFASRSMINFYKHLHGHEVFSDDLLNDRLRNELREEIGRYLTKMLGTKNTKVVTEMSFNRLQANIKPRSFYLHADVLVQIYDSNCQRKRGIFGHESEHSSDCRATHRNGRLCYMAVNKQDSKSPDILGIQRREVSPYVISEVSCWGHSDSDESGEHRDDFHRSESEEDDQEREHSRSDNRRGKPKRHLHSSEEDGDESLHSALGRAFGLHVGRPAWSVNPGYQVTYDIGTKPGYHSSSSVKYYKWSTTPSWSYALGRQLGRQNDIGPESFQLGSVKYRRRPMIWRSNPGRQMRRYGGHESFHSGRRRN